MIILENRLFICKNLLMQTQTQDTGCWFNVFFFCFGLIEGKERRYKQVDKDFTVALKWIGFKEFVSEYTSL